MTDPHVPSIYVDSAPAESAPENSPGSSIPLRNGHLSVDSPQSEPNSSVSTYSTVSTQPTVSPSQMLEQAITDDEKQVLSRTPFKVSLKQLALLSHELPGIHVLRELGGLNGLQSFLCTDVSAGLSVDEDFTCRIKAYNRNVLPEKKTLALWRFMLIALSEKMLILLTIAAAISLALGLYQTFGTPTTYDRLGNPVPKVDWIEGVAILVAVVIVVCVGGFNDWQKELQFAALNKRKDDRNVKLSGDIMLIEPGDMVPVDGLLVQGHSVRCDESAATGESNSLKKISVSDAILQLESLGEMATEDQLERINPFVISGSKVLEGFGNFLVTAVGPNSAYGKTMMDLRDDNGSVTPLQLKLNNIADVITKWGGGASVLLFFLLLFRFCAELPGNTDTPTEKGETFMQYVITAVTLIAVAVPEGLPLAVTLALAFATKRMLKDNNLVRVLKSCETMGNATTICSDKTGTLTQNKMTVVEGTIGLDIHFSSKVEMYTDSPLTVIPISELSSSIASGVKDLLLQSILANTTAFEDASSADIFVGSKTETALLGGQRSHSKMTNINIVQLFPFDSAKKCMGVLISVPHSDGRITYRLLVKGGSEIVLAVSKRYIVSSAPGDDIESLKSEELSKEQQKYIESLINLYAQKSLRTIGLVYRDFPVWPPVGVSVSEDQPDHVENLADVLQDMYWIGLTGIMDPLRPGVIDAVKDCQRAGVFVRMVTGDNFVTAKAIATECGIYTPDGVVMQAPAFRVLSTEDQDAILPKLQVLARSSPQDKKLLVQRLKALGETVAVTGDGTNDAPALTMADVGFSMGITGIEVAKEASDIILMDDNFSSIVKALLWGRAVNDAVKKFLQFQVTVNITAVIITYVTALRDPEGDSVLSAVQLLWVNLIMDTFAALALATDPPTRTLLDRQPARKSDNMITVTMWKMIIGQAIFQIAATFVLYFGGPRIWNYTSEEDLQRLDSMTFNTFVWIQFFNMFINRRLDNGLNFFEGISRNYFFAVIAAIMCGGQILIMFVGGQAFAVVRISGAQWAVSIMVGVLSIPVGLFLRQCVPDSVAYEIYKPFGSIAGFIGRGLKRLLTIMAH
ncbi:hypothetical protein V1517DRAFT_347293 [Lipomyces orientalis]|uniref:Uncharacterized protein n=1 Tax=Lipomyces orientalis TaxID=1233043 RepID=A0ACC3TKG6_9ASCO